MTRHVTIMANGRMSLPASIRKRMGLKGGGALLLEETSDGIVLRSVSQAVARAQGLAKKYANHQDASVEAFLANRKTDSGE
ncbi:MAG: hypothetical protein NVS3B5_05240 [Sphingomicrobium sp.]